jgi:hypothetical protein
VLVDDFMDEWVHWRAGSPVRIGWPSATAFGYAIKPDPRPASVPIDDARAEAVDGAIASFHPRLKGKLLRHYLAWHPVEVKARRARMSVKSYKAQIERVKSEFHLHLRRHVKTAKFVYEAEGMTNGQH